MKFLCEQCKAKYQIADDKVVGRTVRMKCRKCGHLIEVRAAVTESSATSGTPSTVPPASVPPPSTAAPKPPVKTPPPRPTSLSASLTAPRPSAPKPDKVPGALAGAFKTTVQREEEVSAPFDMSELSPGNDWYVAVNGVPVGPVRVAEIRRKASMGAVTEDSLVWQEGLDEWRALRLFPDLVAIVREAAGGGRSSVLPPPGSSPPSRSPSVRPPPPSTGQRAPSPRILPAGGSLASRNNVVAITSRLATAERLDVPAPAPVSAPRPAAMAPPSTDARALPSVVADPFALPALAPAPAAAEVAQNPAPAAQSIPPAAYRAQKGPPLWILLVLLVIAAAFGITMAIALILRRAQPAPQVVAQVSAPPLAAPTSGVAQGVTAGTGTASQDTSSTLAVNTVSIRSSGSAGGAPKGAAAPSATSTGRILDLHGIGTGPTLAPANDPGGDGSKSSGQCMSEGQIAQVIGFHQVPIRRLCWERNAPSKLAVNIGVLLAIGPDGNPQSASASGDDPAVAQCVEKDVRGWHFPALGCSQKTAFSFKFVRQ